MNIRRWPLYLTINFCLFIFICVFMLHMFRKNSIKTEMFQRGRADRKIELLAREWTANQTPSAARLIKIVVSDSLENENILHLPKSISLRMLCSAAKKRFFGKKKDVRFMGQGANITNWSIDVMSWAAERNRMIKAMAENIAKAKEAGARVEVVAKGYSARLALQAIKKALEIVPKGKPVEVEKFVVLGMNKKHLQTATGWASWFKEPRRMRPLRRPQNLKEWVNIYTEGSSHSRAKRLPETIMIELFNQNVDGKIFSGNEYLLPADILTQGIPYFNDNEILRAIERMLRSPNMERHMSIMKRYMSIQVQKVKYRKMPVSGDPRPASQPQDSLSLINVPGGLKKRMKDAEKTVPSRKSGNATNCKDGTCNWYDAKAYCGGRLPTVAQLKSMCQAECTGGRRANTCNKWYWSSEEVGATLARVVVFGRGGGVVLHYKDSSNDVRCR